MQGWDASTYGERWADIYDEWYGAPPDTDDCLAALHHLAGPPAATTVVVELGVGTGRLALPLAAAGYDVRAVDSSPAMVARLRSKPGGAELPVTVGDMADLVVPGGVEPGAVRLAFCTTNTFNNLTTDDAQRRCLGRVAELLEPRRGRFAVELFVPAEDLGDGPDGGVDARRRGTVGVRSLGPDHLVLTADVVDPVSRTVSGQFVEITEAGVRLRPFHVRYVSAAELDGLAHEAGLGLVERWSSWDRTPWGGDGPAQVSVYRRS